MQVKKEFSLALSNIKTVRKHRYALVLVNVQVIDRGYNFKLMNNFLIHPYELAKNFGTKYNFVNFRHNFATRSNFCYQAAFPCFIFVIKLLNCNGRLNNMYLYLSSVK